MTLSQAHYGDLTDVFSSPLRRLTDVFSAPFSLTISASSAKLELKGGKIEIFTISIVFRKVKSLIYETFHLPEHYANGENLDFDPLHFYFS